MNKTFLLELEKSRTKLLNVVPRDRDITFIRLFGNIGDDLIYAGIRQILRDVPYTEISIRDIKNASGSFAIVAGGGSWCSAFQLMPNYLKSIERQYHKVVVFPSSFDVNIESVRESLRQTSAFVFARERESYEQIRDLCSAELAHDCAFFFDFQSFQREGQGVLNCFRTDQEAVPFTLPPDNNDISVSCETLDEWLWTIARHHTIRTDRTHVTIAAAMMGKLVKYRPSNYHKLPGIVQFAVSDFSVELLDGFSGTKSSRVLHDEPLEESPSRFENWSHDSRHVGNELAGLVPPGSSLLLVDDGQLDLPELATRHVIPFTERAGLYFGPPPDDVTALKEMKRLLEVRPLVVAFAWPAFWWLKSFPTLRHYLESTFPCIHQDDRLIVFDLRSRDL